MVKLVFRKDVAESDADVCVSRFSTAMANIRMIGSRFVVRRDGGSMLARWSTWYVRPVPMSEGKSRAPIRT